MYLRVVRERQVIRIVTTTALLVVRKKPYIPITLFIYRNFVSDGLNEFLRLNYLQSSKLVYTYKESRYPRIFLIIFSREKKKKKRFDQNLNSIELNGNRNFSKEIE